MHRNRGFTLIELLIVIAIIGLLASIVLAALQGAKEKARDSRRTSDLKQLSMALELYNDQTGHYPISLSWTYECQVPGNGNWISDNGNYAWSTQYVPKLMRDPSENCASNPSQEYGYWSDGKGYELSAQLERPQGGGIGPATEYYNGSSFSGLSEAEQGPLSVVITSRASDPTGTAPIPITAIFSAPVVGFSAGEISGGDIASISGFTQTNPTTYTFNVTPQGDGTVEVSIPAGAAQDGQGNSNSVGNFSIVYDTQPPHPALSPAPLPTTVSAPFTVTVNFNVSVADFTAGDISVTNGSVSNFTTQLPNNGENYSFTVTPGSAGGVSVVIPSGVTHNSVGTANVASNSLSTTYTP